MWALIQNAKASGIDIASVSVGGCRVELRAPSAAPHRSDVDQPGRPPRGGIYDAFGGEMMIRQRPSGARAATPVVPGEDFQPALEVDG